MATSNFTNPIVSGKVIDIDERKGLTVRLDDGRLGIVDADQISDVDIGPISTYFKFFPKYKFKILNKKKTNDNDNDSVQLSYKLCHPKLVKDKRKIIPTSNHFNTLKKMIWFEIYIYDKRNNINEISTKKLNINLDDIELIRKKENE